MKRKEADLHAPYLAKYFHNASTFPEQGEEFGAQLALNSAVDGTNREAISDILEMLLGAGSDTTSVALHNILKVIALHPEAAVAAQAGILPTIPIFCSI
jgi:cytochrome P450